MTKRNYILYIIEVQFIYIYWPCILQPCYTCLLVLEAFFVDLLQFSLYMIMLPVNKGSFTSYEFVCHFFSCRNTLSILGEKHSIFLHWAYYLLAVRFSRFFLSYCDVSLPFLLCREFLIWMTIENGQVGFFCICLDDHFYLLTWWITPIYFQTQKQFLE